MSEKLPPQTAIRLLRAKAADLENRAAQQIELYGGPLRPVTELGTDIALLATLLADVIEGMLDDASRV